jgi:sphingomyelin phosphodiesterase acid-like 3
LPSIRKLSGLPIAYRFWLLISLIFPLAARGQWQASSLVRDAQRPRSVTSAGVRTPTIPALLVSDIHFDPFDDPARVQQLVDAPPSRWSSILSSPPSSTQTQAFTALQEKCSSRGVDTPYTLLRSSLGAMRSWMPDAKFVTVSGDLVAHSFLCRFRTLLPGSTQRDYQAFMVKTLSFVMGELRDSFPGVPLYLALGNNDTACDDYHLDEGSDFLALTGRIVAEGLPSSQRQQALGVFAKGGYYSLTMGAPMRNTRLIAINDIFLSPKYRTCANQPDPAAATAEMVWLKKQLAQARRLGQKVWVVGHIPPGVDPYSTQAKGNNICGKQSPEMFLTSGELSDQLIDDADLIQLGIFAHSHMDEFRLLERESGDPSPSPKHRVAIKVVPSISPVDGNNPSFILARVNPSSAALENYQVIAASNPTGIAATWSKQYDYAQTYHKAQFSPAALKELIAAFENDRSAKLESSKQYILHYFVGDASLELKPFWSQYVCALANHTGKTFASCACLANK